jgi:hypothetical protein
MAKRWAVAFLVVATSFAGVRVATAAKMRVDVDQSNIDIPQGNYDPIPLKLRVTNVGDDTIPLFLWFVAVKIVPDASAVGEIKLTGFSEPPDSIFWGLSPFGINVFGSLPAAPMEPVVFSHGAFSTDNGVPIAPGASASILDLEFKASPGASGRFSVYMYPLDLDNPETSSWSRWEDMGAQNPYENFGVLTTLSIVPEPGTVTGALVGVATVMSFCPSWRRRRSHHRASLVTSALDR